MPTIGKIRFQPGGAIHDEFRKALDGYLTQPGVKAWGFRRLYLDATLSFAWFAASYVGLVLWAHSWEVPLLALSTVMALAAFVINSMHDANHNAFARSKRGNWLGGLALEFAGGSSPLWKIKHDEHHGKTNVVGADTDIEMPPFGRMAPSQPWRPWYRYQQYYLWLLYGVMAVRWFLWGDFQTIRIGVIGQRHLKPFTRGQWVTLVVGKLVAISWIAVIPLWLHWSWTGALFTGVVILASAWTFGFLLSVIFQLAHCIDETQFSSLADVDSQGRMHFYWEENQALATSDFCPRNWFLNWYVGGLNRQIEHHLFPGIPHTHLKRLSPKVKEIFERHGLVFICHDSLWSALVSHYRHLKKMGLPPEEVARVTT